ncbi:hypothetical protein C8Q79DRAFT_966920 [Trametes meyenii]|nr:hypothetical protein C8Q79DRAFT_966920 [Trametes meyenii]
MHHWLPVSCVLSRLFLRIARSTLVTSQSYAAHTRTTCADIMMRTAAQMGPCYDVMGSPSLTTTPAPSDSHPH